MMHGRGKSDPVMGAVKPANKAAPTAAESMEQRTGTKGNVRQQSTRRAQDRESVSQALERIRQVARQRKEERFTSLTTHISVDLLRTAFLELKKDAAPGVDGLTWRTYAEDLDLYAERTVMQSPRREDTARRGYLVCITQHNGACVQPS
jgi:RNA-directed DNA polymerase